MFTVKQLSDLANVTPRTLHYYDQIGLLKPSHVGGNGYRYYGEQSLLELQQILFYRELDLPLENIKKIMSGPDFDILIALESHKAQITKRIARMENLLQTVDDTILHLKGKKKMSNRQIFSGFTPEEEERYTAEAEKMYDPETVRASTRKWKGYSTQQKQNIFNEGRQVYEDMITAMPKGARSPDVQAVVERWHKHMDYFWTPNLDQLLGLAELYNTDPRFKATFDQLDPNLAAFMLEAVRVYVTNKN